MNIDNGPFSATAMHPTLLLVTLFAASGCVTVGPDYETPDNAALTAQPIGSDSALQTDATEPAHDWWLSLNDTVLNGLVTQALEANRDLRVAAANVDEARALLRLQRTNRRPQGEITADASRRQIAGAGLGLDDSSLGDSDYRSIELAASWELDFFGRVRRATEAALADAERAEALRREAEVLVIAETVRAYADYRGARILLAVAEQNLAAQNDTVIITQARLNEGLGSQLDVARAISQAKSTEATLPPLNADRVAATARLATLTGSSSSAVEGTLAAFDDDSLFPSPPVTLAIGDAAALIERRPDVTAAERALAAATARIGLNKADYFPTISLVGDVGLSAQSASDLDTSAALGYSIGPRLVWSGFDKPRVQSRVQAAGARAEAALAAYEQTLFVALEEVQTALVAYGRERVRFDTLVVAADSAREAARLARLRYDDGADDFLTVLDADRRALAAEASREQSRAALTSRYAVLFRALGAGWRSFEDDLLAAR